MAAAKSAKITKDYLFFESKGSTKANIIFYQGALVEEKAYAGLAQDLSKIGYDVYILKTPLNLPILSSQKALSVIKAKKCLSCWSLSWWRCCLYECKLYKIR